MADFNIRTDAVDVEQIMRQIRARIQEKRGVDYTEEQIQELANVKLERFLDPKGVRSDLVQQFRRAHERRPDSQYPEQFSVDANDLYGSSRSLVRLFRKIFNPLLKLVLNTNRLVQVLHQQSEINKFTESQVRFLREQRDEMDVLYYELVHNLVLELTRIGIENRNLKMRLESMSSRLDFDERRARALEGVVQYRPGSGPSREPEPPRPSAPHVPQVAQPAAPQGEAVVPAEDAAAGESTTARRRRRRRRGRRGGRARTGADGISVLPDSAEEAVTPPHGDPMADAGLDQDAGDSDSDADGLDLDADLDSDSSDEKPEPPAQ